MRSHVIPRSCEAVLALGLLVAGASASASTFTYDFETLSVDQVLLGQDGWTQINTQASPRVAVGPGINASKTSAVIAPGAGNFFGAYRTLGGVFTYTPADTAVFWQFDSLALGADPSQAVLVGLGGNSASFGRAGARAWIWSDNGPFYGDTLVTDHWYQYRLELDFSVRGVSSTLLYRDLTAGEALFTMDSLLRDVNLGLFTPFDRRYQFANVFVRQDTTVGSVYVDNIRTGIVPAPPALALLGTAVVALLPRARKAMAQPLHG
jgi:hypothetical protein